MNKLRIDFYETKNKYGDWGYDAHANGILLGRIHIREADYQYSPKYYFRSKDGVLISARDAHTLIEMKRNLIKSYNDANGKIFEERNTPNFDIADLPNDDNEFYPTPKSICGKMIACVQWQNVHTVLEPSAGKGDICDAIKAFKKRDYHSKLDIDCIELDLNLRFVLKGKGYRTVHDNFLSYETNKKYDLIIMNPPFSRADAHLMNAIEMQEKNGGQIVCLLNAETLLNPFTNLRKLLIKKIREHKAIINYLKSPFKQAERKTSANVALVYFNIPSHSRESEFFSRMKKAKDSVYEKREDSEIAPNDKIEALIRSYEIESSASLEFLREYDTLRPKIMNGSETFSQPSIGIKIGGREISGGLNAEIINDYLQIVRYKYWRKLFDIPDISKQMTTAIRNSYDAKIKDMANYEFSRFNIQEVIFDIRAQLQAGVEDEIERLFDKLSSDYCYYEGNNDNIHYYNGWKTNKAHKVNYKVIIPAYGSFATGYVYDKYHRLIERKNSFIDSRSCYSVLADLEKTLDYLDGNDKNRIRTDLANRLHFAETRRETRNIDCTYFNVTFYKKGTCHITFRDDARILIDRLNIYVGKRRSWLPPSYGTKAYVNLSEEEKTVVDSFDGGEEDYNKVYENQNYYLIESRNLLMLSEGADNK